MRNLGLLLLGLVICASPAFAQSEYVYEGHRYTLVTGDWHDAQSMAQTWGGNLVSINSLAEEVWLKSVFGTTANYWIGFTDSGREGSWEWVNGDPVTYTNWAPGEPNNFLWMEHYALMNWGSDDKWNDGASWYSNYGIAEKMAPEPLSAALFLIGGVGLGLARARKRRRAA